jgi:hypothetical protein
MFNANLFLVTICTPSFKTTKEAGHHEKNSSKALKSKNYTAHIYNDVNIENGIINFQQH